MTKLFQIHPDDNVAVALDDIPAGYSENGITALQDIPKAHKILLCDLKAGESVIKYGYPIGTVQTDLPKGSYVHEHNLKTSLGGVVNYAYHGDTVFASQQSDLSVMAYRRKNGKVGVRNEIWIIPTVGCVNKTAQRLEQMAGEAFCDGIDGVHAFLHPFGCSQMEDDQENTRKILAGLVNHPNAGGVLVVSLGCENNNLSAFRPYLGDVDESRVKFLCAQDVGDELEEGMALLREIYETIKNDTREPVGIENLIVGYKCGGSDAFSGITANALCGRVNDILTTAGAATMLTEVPEMFGAEQILLDRVESKAVFDKAVDMLNGFKQYFDKNGVVCYENPSPGNHAGGITTLEEKSLGCIQKGGSATVTDVLSYGDTCTKAGLNLLTGPGNDIVSVTNMTAAGAHLILFTTGRGTSLGAPVPTIKISSNTALAQHKPNWIDFDAGSLTNGADMSALTNDLLQLILDTANGKQTKNEHNGYRDIAIFKNGVIM